MELTLLLIIAALLVALLVLTLTRNNRAQSEEMQRALRQPGRVESQYSRVTHGNDANPESGFATAARCHA